MKKIEVLYIQTPEGGGSLNALYDMLKEVDKEKVEATVLCYERNKYTEILENLKGISVRYLNIAAPEKVSIRSLRFLNYFTIQANFLRDYFISDKIITRQTLKVIKEVKPDIIHHNNDVSLNRQAIKAASKAGIKQIIHNRSLNNYKKNYLNYWFYKSLLKQCDYYINITSAVKEHYDSLFNLDADRSIIMHDFVDNAQFCPAERSAAVSSEFLLSNTDFIIVCVGRIIEWKGQDVLIEAINLAREQLQNCKVLFVGPYEKGVGSIEYYKLLQAKIDKYQLNDHIIFTGNRSNIADFINTADVVIHSSVKPEPQGLVIIEALLCNKPVIASSAGGAKELIEKYGGYLSEMGDYHQMAEKLVQLKNEKTETGKIHTHINYMLLKEDFDPKIKSETLSNIYSKLVA